MKFSKMVVVCLVAFAAACATASPSFLSEFRTKFLAQMTRSNSDLGDSGCIFKPTGGKEYDFNTLATTTFKGTDTDNPTYSYTANICAVAEESNCRSADGSICQYDKTPPVFVTSLGSFHEEPAPVYSLIDPAKPASGVKIYMENSPRCGGLIVRPHKTTLLITCGSNSESFLVDEPETCNYTVEMKSKIACLGGDGDDGLSGGAIFLIILFVCIFLYVAIGCIVCMKKYEKRGLDACPHKDFWFAIPGLTKDGCIFTVGKIKGCFGSKTITTSSGEYESA